jgi:hypothetical protein
VTALSKLAPRQALKSSEFLILADNIEHKIMVERLINGGLMRSEAEQSIASRGPFHKRLNTYFGVWNTQINVPNTKITISNFNK